MDKTGGEGGEGNKKTIRISYRKKCYSKGQSTLDPTSDNVWTKKLEKNIPFLFFFFLVETSGYEGL